MRARSRSGVSTCSRGRGSLGGIVVTCTWWRMSGHRVVRVGRLRACAPNCRPAAPSLSAQGPTRLAARRGSCVAYPPWWNSNVKVSLFASCLPGGAGRTWQRARVPVEQTLAELDHVRSLVLSDAEREAGVGASALSTAFSSCLCSVRLTSSPVSAPLLEFSATGIGGSCCRQGMLPG